MKLAFNLQKNCNNRNQINLNLIGALTSKPYAFHARSWELKSVNSIDILDTFMSSIRFDYRDKEILRVIPRNDEWISDKVRFFYDGLKYQRLHYPMIKYNRSFVSVSWKETFGFLACIFGFLQKWDSALSFKANFIIGEMVDLESLYFIKHIKNKFDSFMQTSVIRAEASKHNIDFRENYTMSTSEAQLKKADLILLIGANLRAENPVLNSLLRKHALHNDDVKIFSIGTSSNLTYFCKHLGTTLYVFKQLMEGKHKLSSFLLKAKNPIILVGTSFLNRLDLQHFDNLIYVLKKYLPKLTVNFLNSHSSIISSNEVGLNTIFNINEDLSNVDLQVNYALNVVCDNMVNAVKVWSNKAKKSSINIYQAHHFDKMILDADIILPSAVFTEKNALYMNIFGKLKETKRIYFPPKEARVDWRILLFLYKTLMWSSNKMPFTAVSEISNIFGNKEGDDVLFTNLLNVNVCSLQTIRSLLSDHSPLLLHINSSVDLPKMIYILYNKFTMTKNSFLIINNCFSSKVDLYYGNDSISKASLVLQLRAKLESSAFKNFYKE